MIHARIWDDEGSYNEEYEDDRYALKTNPVHRMIFNGQLLCLERMLFDILREEAKREKGGK